jgi:iron complex outermembrane receptor protein
MNKIQRLLAATAVAALGTAAGLPAHAADNAIEEVVVTAQKRAENVQDVPISMEVVSAKKLEAFHTDTFKALNVPNMNTQAVGGNDVIYMRGFGSPSQNFAFDQAVSLYVDGIYGGRSRQFMAPFFDLQRIEVLRGPQGALFGKNTAAGAISIISAQPTKTFQAEATGVYNFNQDGYELSGYASGPITEALSARLAVKLVDKDGYIDNAAVGQEEPTTKSQLARLSLKFEPNDNFDYVAKAEYSWAESLGNGTVSGPLNAAQKPVTHRYAVEDPRLGLAGFETLSWNVAGTGNLRLGEFTLTAVTGYSYFNASHVNNFDQTNPAWRHRPRQRVQQLPGTLRPVVAGDPAAVPDRRQVRVHRRRLLRQRRLPVRKLQPQHHHGPGRIRELRRLPAKRRILLDLRPGRVSRQRRPSASRAACATRTRARMAPSRARTCRGPFPLRPPSNAKGEISEGGVDPSITLQYDVAPRTMVYASYGQGSKSGGFVSNSAGTTNCKLHVQARAFRELRAGRQDHASGREPRSERRGLQAQVRRSAGLDLQPERPGLPGGQRRQGQQHRH